MQSTANEKSNNLTGVASPKGVVWAKSNMYRSDHKRPRYCYLGLRCIVIVFAHMFESGGAEAISFELSANLVAQWFIDNQVNVWKHDLQLASEVDYHQGYEY